MTPERWALVKRVFHEALEQAEEARPSVLAQACEGDAALQAELESLLQAHQRAGTFIERLAAPADAARVIAMEAGTALLPADDLVDRRPLQPGDRRGPYVIIGLLGVGGMGEVYLANHLALGRLAAIKVLPTGFGRLYRERLLLEAQAAALLQHPCIASFHELLEAEGTTALVMEYVPGPTLRQRLVDGPLAMAQALSIAACLLEALAHAHAAGILHRDIKPENVIVTGEHAAKLLDFGIAVRFLAQIGGALESTAADARMPAASTILGSPGYMSPEQLRGDPLDARSDLFAVGAVLYEMISGSPAFPGLSWQERLAALHSCTPAALGEAVCPPVLRQVIARALARDPQQRFSSARAFLTELKASTGNVASAAPESYSRGRQLCRRLEKGSFDEAQGLLEAALATDPAHSPALSKLAAVHCLRFPFTTDPRELTRGLDYAARALAADAANAEAYVWQGYALSRLGRHEEALAAEWKAMELDPFDYHGPYFAGGELQMLGRRRDSVRLFQRAVEVAPDAGVCWLYLGWMQLCLNLLAEARDSLGKAVALEAGSNSMPGVAGYLGECLRRAKMLELARTHCLLGLDSVESSDHMYRDSLRAFCLSALGRTAIEQGNTEAARSAFGQLIGQMQGRPRALGGGHLVVQALAGLAQSGEGSASFSAARDLFAKRDSFNFQYFHGCHDDVTLLALARAADAVGNVEEADTLLARARQAGSIEPFARPRAGLGNGV